MFDAKSQIDNNTGIRYLISAVIIWMIISQKVGSPRFAYNYVSNVMQQSTVCCVTKLRGDGQDRLKSFYSEIPVIRVAF